MEYRTDACFIPRVGSTGEKKRIKQKKKKRIVVCGGEEQRLEAD